MNYISLDYGNFMDMLGTYVEHTINSYSIIMAIFVVHDNRHFPYHTFITAIYHTCTLSYLKLVVIRLDEKNILAHRSTYNLENICLIVLDYNSTFV